MNKRSILFTINLTFFIAFLLISVSFGLLYNMNQKREDFFIHKRGMDISRMFMDEHRFFGISEKMKQDVERFDFSFIDNEQKIDKILHDKSLRLRHSERRNVFNFEYFELNNSYYIYIFTPNERVILKDNIVKNRINGAIIIYSVIVAIFGFLYFSIINKLKPLKNLNNLVKDFGNEEFDIKYTPSGEDEISKLIREFNISAKKLKSIKESRNIFIRNIMHELKTPITKGKFLIHLPNTEANADKMQKVFYRLEALINEFAAIEELISVKKDIAMKEYYLEDIVDNAIDILMCDENEVIKYFENLKLNINFDIFSIAVKNLLDNGIKYSDNRKVVVKTEGTNIVFENSGEKLVYPLENYFEPFFRGDNVKSNQSFGLGLYIVKHILQAHALMLKYEYQEGVSRFIISRN
ncbi:HAMP domain-containing histidine kinase [bacterium]|nr:HAMP domain-containing histidine kinase [bacterium]MBU1883007.1 HAMP domain-containing histidine kinase [bacterium]